MNRLFLSLRAAQKISASPGSPFTPEQLCAQCPLCSRVYLEYLDTEGYLGHRWENGQLVYVLLPKGEEYLRSEHSNRLSFRVSLLALLFSFIAAIPAILQFLQWLRQLL